MMVFIVMFRCWGDIFDKVVGIGDDMEGVLDFTASLLIHSTLIFSNPRPVLSPIWIPVLQLRHASPPERNMAV
jgi:hypothetical protein